VVLPLLVVDNFSHRFPTVELKGSGWLVMSPR